MLDILLEMTLHVVLLHNNVINFYRGFRGNVSRIKEKTDRMMTCLLIFLMRNWCRGQKGGALYRNTSQFFHLN